MRAANRDGVAMLERLLAYRLDGLIQHLEDQVGGIERLQRERRVDHIGAS